MGCTILPQEQHIHKKILSGTAGSRNIPLQANLMAQVLLHTVKSPF